MSSTLPTKSGNIKEFLSDMSKLRQGNKPYNVSLPENESIDDFLRTMHKLHQCNEQYNKMIHSRTILKPKSFDECRNKIPGLNNTIIKEPCYVPKGDYINKEVSWFGREDLKIAVLETKYGFFIQPREKHLRFDFENFFQIGYGNSDYDINKTVYVPLFS